MKISETAAKFLNLVEAPDTQPTQTNGRQLVTGKYQNKPLISIFCYNPDDRSLEIEVKVTGIVKTAPTSLDDVEFDISTDDYWQHDSESGRLLFKCYDYELQADVTDQVLAALQPGRVKVFLTSDRIDMVPLEHPAEE